MATENEQWEVWMWTALFALVVLVIGAHERNKKYVVMAMDVEGRLRIYTAPRSYTESMLRLHQLVTQFNRQTTSGFAVRRRVFLVPFKPEYDIYTNLMPR